MREWLQRLLGLVPGQYSCPNRGCGSADMLPLGVITRAVPGQPWKQRKVGCLVLCAKCGERYAVTLTEGVWTPTPPPSEPSSRSLMPGSPWSENALREAHREAERMTSDLRRPSEPA